MKKVRPVLQSDCKHLSTWAPAARGEGGGRGGGGGGGGGEEEEEEEETPEAVRMGWLTTHGLS